MNEVVKLERHDVVAIVTINNPPVNALSAAVRGGILECMKSAIADPEVKARLVATTEEAVARGVFGAPSFFVGDAMFFGQDRLDFVREALIARR